MLPVYDIPISRKGIRAINDRIDDMLDRVFDLSNDLKDTKIFDFLFPTYLMAEKPEWCIRKLRQFRTMVQDYFERDYLEPIYEYILYQLLHNELDLLRDLEELPESIIDEITDENYDENHYVEDINGYLEFMFRDYDFLTVSNGLESELEDYIEIMPEDIRNKVRRERKEREQAYQKEDVFIQTLLRALEQIESQPTLYENCNEPQINDHILAIIKQYLYTQGLVAEREKLQGFALKRSGEADFYVFDMENGENLAVGESKDARLFDKTIKQLLGYMTRNTHFGFTISINYTSDLSVLKEQIIRSLQEEYTAQEDFKLVDLLSEDKYLVSVHTMPEEHGARIRIYHLFLNLRTVSRRAIARNARG